MTASRAWRCGWMPRSVGAPIWRPSCWTGSFWRPLCDQRWRKTSERAGVHAFQVRAGFSGPLSLFPIEAIDPDDGTVSLAWNIWSDDPVLINGAVHIAASPVSGSSGDVQPQSYLVEVPQPHVEILDADVTEG